MTGIPQYPEWNADKAIDGRTIQDYQSNSCAISEVDVDKLTKSYWKVWIDPYREVWNEPSRPLNIAFLEIYFRTDSKLRERERF